jgi:hypothetical protein
MTHPATPEVGGEANAPATDPKSAFEDIAAEMLGDDQEEEETEGEGVETEAEEAEVDADELEESEEEGEAEQPPITPPNSLTPEEKEAFAKLPREAQEFTARRIGELEKGFQSKAQEAAQAREAARTEALQFAEKLKAEAVERLNHYAQQLQVRPPDARLFQTDPAAYAQQLEVYQYAQAQREQAQHEAQKAQAEREHYLAELQKQETETFRQRLQTELPEAYDPANGQTFINELAATAKALDYDDDAINRASIEELKALKVAAQWKAKADRYDKAMAKKMERVRAGKNPPPIAKPGVSKGPDASRRVRADNAWEAAKTAKSRSARDNALATWAEQAGWLD